MRKTIILDVILIILLTFNIFIVFKPYTLLYAVSPRTTSLKKLVVPLVKYHLIGTGGEMTNEEIESSYDVQVEDDSSTYIKFKLVAETYDGQVLQLDEKDIKLPTNEIIRTRILDALWGILTEPQAIYYKGKRVKDIKIIFEGRLGTINYRVLSYNPWTLLVTGSVSFVRVAPKVTVFLNGEHFKDHEEQIDVHKGSKTVMTLLSIPAREIEEYAISNQLRNIQLYVQVEGSYDYYASYTYKVSVANIRAGETFHDRIYSGSFKIGLSTELTASFQITEKQYKYTIVLDSFKFTTPTGKALSLDNFEIRIVTEDPISGRTLVYYFDGNEFTETLRYCGERSYEIQIKPNKGTTWVTVSTVKVKPNEVKHISLDVSYKQAPIVWNELRTQPIGTSKMMLEGTAFSSGYVGKYVFIVKYVGAYTGEKKTVYFNKLGEVKTCEEPKEILSVTFHIKITDSAGNVVEEKNIPLRIISVEKPHYEYGFHSECWTVKVDTSPLKKYYYGKVEVYSVKIEVVAPLKKDLSNIKFEIDGKTVTPYLHTPYRPKKDYEWGYYPFYTKLGRGTHIIRVILTLNNVKYVRTCEINVPFQKNVLIDFTRDVLDPSGNLNKIKLILDVRRTGSLPYVEFKVFELLGGGKKKLLLSKMLWRSTRNTYTIILNSSAKILLVADYYGSKAEKVITVDYSNSKRVGSVSGFKKLTHPAYEKLVKIEVYANSIVGVKKTTYEVIIKTLTDDYDKPIPDDSEVRHVVSETPEKKVPVVKEVKAPAIINGTVSKDTVQESRQVELVENGGMVTISKDADEKVVPEGEFEAIKRNVTSVTFEPSEDVTCTPPVTTEKSGEGIVSKTSIIVSSGTKLSKMKFGFIKRLVYNLQSLEPLIVIVTMGLITSLLVVRLFLARVKWSLILLAIIVMVGITLFELYYLGLLSIPALI